uniref:Cytochrome P450 n=2 Tax=Hormoscilla spongeliae TaxID=190968 RepID=A0A1S6M1P3_9CYAN|nr:cytochrome P450 [Hormoscilla spongeliae GUM034]
MSSIYLKIAMVLQKSSFIELNNSSKMPPPGPPALPFVSMLPFFSKYLHIELHKLGKKYGSIFQLRVGGKKLVVLNNIETVKEALLKQQDSFNARADFDVFQQPPQRHFLELKSGENWKKHHSIVGKAMHTFVVSKSDTLESWALEQAENLANTLLKFGSQPIDPDLYVPLATSNFMQRLIFDKRGGIEDAKKDTAFTEYAYNLRYIPCVIEGVKLEFFPGLWQLIFKLSRWKIVPKFLKALAALEHYVSQNVEQHRESFHPENLRDVTDGLLQASSELTESDRNELGLGDNDIVNGSLMQFAGAGGGLPSFILRWGLLYMITHPDIQTQIQKELDEVVGREQQPRLEHRGKLPLMEACINEILRHSSLTTMPPINYATTADTTLEGYFIPKNTPLVINYYALTRDERYWEEPEKFNPYRFLDENGQLRKNLLDKFYPFGMGARRCIGEYLGRLMVFLFFTNLMHKCNFEKVHGKQLSFESLLGGVFSTPQDFKVLVKPRF